MGVGYHTRQGIGNRFARLGLVVAAAGLLTACGSTGIGNPLAGLGGGQDDAADGGPARCPSVLIVEDAAALTLFSPGGGRDLTDIVATARFGPFEGQCDYFDDRVDVRLELLIVAERGPALTGDRVVVEYFVSILDPQDRIMVKREFPVELGFASASLSQAASREVLVQSIPLADLGTAAEHEILIGFQLDPAQLDFNRR